MQNGSKWEEVMGWGAEILKNLPEHIYTGRSKWTAKVYQIIDKSIRMYITRTDP
jgi:hypothetical protein